MFIFNCFFNVVCIDYRMILVLVGDSRVSLRLEFFVNVKFHQVGSLLVVLTINTMKSVSIPPFYCSVEVALELLNSL